MCSTGARASANSSELAIHDERVDEAQLGMLKSFGKAADDLEPKALPQFHSALVRANDEIELHGAKPALPCPLQRVRAHRATHAAARRMRRGHVPAIRNVCSAALLIGLQEI